MDLYAIPVGTPQSDTTGRRYRDIRYEVAIVFEHDGGAEGLSPRAGANALVFAGDAVRLSADLFVPLTIGAATGRAPAAVRVFRDGVAVADVPIKERSWSWRDTPP